MNTNIAKSQLKPLNTQHPTIQFTCDTKKDDMLPFLDVNINCDEIFKTSVYRKPTFTGLFTDFHRFLPLLYKINLAKCLFTRAFRICSSFAAADIEFKNVDALLHKNSFPQPLLDKCLRSVLNNVYSLALARKTVQRIIFTRNAFHWPTWYDYSDQTDASLQMIFLLAKSSNQIFSVG